MKYKRILIIDDDEDDQDFITEAVESITDSAVVTVLNNGIEAIQKLAAKKIIADLIFLDIHMPLMDGSDFIKQVRKDTTLQNIPIVMMTGLTNSPYEEIARISGVEVILKPSSMMEFTKVLKPFLISEPDN